jgi:hypothetical protein
MDENTALLRSIDQTTKKILGYAGKPAGTIRSFMDWLGYVLTVFGIVGGLYAFVDFIGRITGGR